MGDRRRDLAYNCWSKVHLVDNFRLLLPAVLTYGRVFLEVEELFPIIWDIERERVS